MRDRVLSGLLAALDRALVRSRPFAHFAIEGAFPADVYDEMLARLPGDADYGPDNPAKYSLPDGSVARGTLPLASAAGPVWREIDAALRAPALRERLLWMLRGDLSFRFRVRPADVAAIPAHPRTLLVRDRPGYWIEPHPDSPAKVVTVQFYLPRDASQAVLGTSLYRFRPWRLRNWLATGRPLEEFHRFRFLPNAGYAFAVGWFSWHGVEKIAEGAGVRDSLMLVYYRC